MLNILGVGSAYPTTDLDNSALAELSGDSSLSGQIEEALEINSRSSVLPIDYLNETGNQNPREALGVAQETPTSLGVAAAKQAMQRAGITTDQVGLILGATSTPYQTTPSESQRIGKELGLKIPAFDLFCGTADFSLFLHTLGNWKGDRLPEYVLCVSTNCPTLKVNYREGFARCLLGDAASAAVVSFQHTGKFALRTAGYFSDASRSKDFTFPLYGHAQFERETLLDWTAACLRHLKEQAAMICPDLSLEESVIIGSQVGSKLDREALGIGSLLSNSDRRGCSIGSSSFSVLGDHWETLSTSLPVSLFMAGPGSSSGLAVLEPNSGG